MYNSQRRGEHTKTNREKYDAKSHKICYTTKFSASSLQVSFHETQPSLVGTTYLSPSESKWPS